jgi:putative spermidine/putrescine transport system ATP-binding protein
MTDPALPISRGLDVRHLTKRYGSAHALSGVCLHVPRGRFVTLLGPSGSGKTSLLMAIAGFVAPDAGTITLDGAPIGHLPPERRNFGMVFQGYALFPHLSIAENVAFPLRIRGVPRAEITSRVSQALDSVQLAPLGSRMPRQLSGGQQQRVALARALVFQPALLLLDEPLSALDRNLRLDMQTELSDLHRRVGLSFIYVTHDQQEALSMSDEIAILRDGKVIQQAAPRALYERPATRFVAEFLGRSNFLPGQVVTTGKDRFSYRCGPHVFTQSGGGPAPGEPVLVTLRPEKIRLVGSAGAEDNWVPAEVTGCSYLGDATQIRVEVAGVGRMSIVQPNWRGGAVEPGSHVNLAWDADASVTVAEDAAS